MELRLWNRDQIERIYLNHVSGVAGNAYLHLTRGKIALVADEAYEKAANVIQAIARNYGVPDGASDMEIYAALRSAAVPAGGRKMAAGARVPSAPYVPVGQRTYGSDLQFANIKNEQEVLVEVDHREPREIDVLIRSAPNTRVERKHLDIGDYRINGNIIVERKTVTDFAESVKSGRLFDQAQRIGFTPDTLGVVILEGDVFGRRESIGMLSSQITGAIGCLSFVQRLTVLTTTDLEHTAYCLAKFAQHDKNGLGYTLSLRKDKTKLQLLDAQRFVLEGITGVSGEMSTALLRHFGTIRAVAMATAKELQSVPGVGPKTAATIADVLSRPYSEGLG